MLKIQNKSTLHPIFLLILICVLLPNGKSYAGQKNRPVPRFVSIKSNEVNARKGPGISYSVEWVYVRKGEPVEVIAEFEQWRKIRDFDKNTGWIHSSVLSGKRFCIVTESQAINMHYRAKTNSVVVAKISSGVRCQIKKCDKLWCKLICQDQTGWVSRENSLWGIYEREQKIK